MTTQALVQARVWKGYRIAARNLGAACPWYRPQGVTAPIVPANSLGTIVAGFDTSPQFTYAKPSLYGKPVWYGLFDPTHVRPGDYMVDAIAGTFFVATIETLHSPLCVSCNAVISVSRPGTAAVAPGPGYYGGATVAGLGVVATSWPGAITLTNKATPGELKNPADPKFGTSTVLLPPSLTAEILPGDVLMDTATAPNRYIVETTETTTLGQRLIVRATGA